MLEKKRILETFDLDAVMAQLRDVVMGESKRVVVAVPTYDESMRYILMADAALYTEQRSDAYKVVQYFKTENPVHEIDMILDSNDADDIVDQSERPIDYVIMLHEFMPSEARYLIESLAENAAGEVNLDMQVLEFS